MITPREKRRHAAGIFLSPRRVPPFLVWGDFHARSRFARSTIPEEKWGTTRSLRNYESYLRPTIGSPSSKYEHRRRLACVAAGPRIRKYSTEGLERLRSIGKRTSALLRNIRNIRICMGKKLIVSVTYENERISIKKQPTLLEMCVALQCGPRADLWPFYGFLCKRLSLYIKVYQGWGLQRSGSTDPRKENGRKIRSNFSNRLQISSR